MPFLDLTALQVNITTIRTAAAAPDQVVDASECGFDIVATYLIVLALGSHVARHEHIGANNTPGQRLFEMASALWPHWAVAHTIEAIQAGVLHVRYLALHGDLVPARHTLAWMTRNAHDIGLGRKLSSEGDVDLRSRTRTLTSRALHVLEAELDSEQGISQGFTWGNADLGSDPSTIVRRQSQHSTDEKFELYAIGCIEWSRLLLCANHVLHQPATIGVVPSAGFASLMSNIDARLSAWRRRLSSGVHAAANGRALADDTTHIDVPMRASVECLAGKETTSSARPAG